MPRTDEKVLERFDAMLSLGKRVLDSKYSPPRGVIGDSRVDGTMGAQWTTSTLSLLERVFGKDSAQVEGFRGHLKGTLTYSPANRAYGVLLAAQQDYAGGYLFDVKQLIQAEVFSDFLEQARHLLDHGYHGASAVVAGSVLEDALRKLCAKHKVKVGDKVKLDQMNADLCKASAYTALRQKQITAWADVRNKAAHGKWDEFGTADVEQMLLGVTTFMADQFG